jgi:photosystem II stability/assembly factor-like uncharacterized protein
MASSTQQIYSSDDAGQTWIATSAPASIYTGVACSSDGWRWVAVAHGGEIRVSPDFGTNWTLANSPNLAWQSVASSSDGSRLVAVPTNGPICISTNSGISWTSSLSPTLQWQSVASSADGSKLAAVAYGGGIYTWQTTPSPKLNITPSDSGLRISWIVPSMPFALQASSGLMAAGWADVPITPSLNFTNLYYEIVVPEPHTNQFYRLKSL